MATPHIPQFLLLGRRRVDLLARRFDPWPAESPDARLVGSGRLTRTEAAILRLLASHAPATVPREEILRALWNLAARSSRTLDTHVTRLRRKLEDDPSAPRHLMTVYRVGYRLEWTADGSASDSAASANGATTHPTGSATADRSATPPARPAPPPPYATPSCPPLPPDSPSRNGHFGRSNNASASS